MIRTVTQRQGRGQAVCRPARASSSPAASRACSRSRSARIREQRQALRLLHEQARQRGRLGAARAQGRGEHPARPPPAAGDPRHRVEPQRRAAAVRARRHALHRRRRRRRRRRPARRARQRPEPGRPARQAPAHRRRHAHRRPPYGIPKDNPFAGKAGLAAGDLGARPAQSVAVLVRPRDRRPLDRRRRPERLGGGRPPQARRSAASTSAGTATRAGTTSPRTRRSPAGRCAGRSPSTAIPPAAHHRRLRLPRAKIAGLSGRYGYADDCSGKMWTLAALGRRPQMLPPQ